MTIFNTLPNAINNGDLVDAPTIMADINSLFTDGNANAAHNGLNSDITQLVGLTTPLSLTQGGTGNASGAGLSDGQCRLVWVSASQIKLIPYNGSALIIAGVSQSVPGAGVTYTNTSNLIGLGTAQAAFTLYYVYAYMVSTTLTLGLSTTGYTFNSSGQALMTTDVTKRLVGMVYTGSGTPGTFQGNTNPYTFSNPVSNCVYTFFNRRQIHVDANNTGTSQYVTSSNTFVQMTQAPPVLVWGDEEVLLIITGAVYNTTAYTTSIYFELTPSFDGLTLTAYATTKVSSGPMANSSTGTNPGLTIVAAWGGAIAEGVHTAAGYAQVVGGSGFITNFLGHVHFTTRG